MKKVVVLLVAVGILAAGGYRMDTGKVLTLKKITKPTIVHKTASKDWITIMQEDFETGTLPDGWVTVDGNGDGLTWLVGVCSDPFYPPDYGTAYLYFSDDSAGIGISSNDTVITMSYPVAGYSDLRFSYSYAFDIYGDEPQHGVVLARFFAGGAWGDWEVLRDYTEDGLEGWDTLQLGGYLPADSVKIAFVYWDDNAWGWGFYVDNFLLEGMEQLEHDVAVTGIQPVGAGIPGEANVTVSVANTGQNDETFPVHVDISGPVGGSFDTTVTLAAGSALDIDFGAFNFEAAGTYTITAYTALEGDEYAGNDTMSVEYTAAWWFTYDDGIVDNAWCYSEGYDYFGWGMRFDIPVDCYIDTVFVGLTNYPNPGEFPSRFVIYDDSDGMPGNAIWQCDTSLDAAVYDAWTGHFIYTGGVQVTAGSYYYFWLDAVGGDGQYLCTDASLSMPDEYYWGDTGAFYIDVEDHGDWFLRIHITSPTGVSEWIPSNPHEEIHMNVTPVAAGNGCVTIRLSALDRHDVKVSVYDAAGRMVKVLYNGELRGNKVITWDVDNVHSGVYFVKLTAGTKEISRKVAIIR